MSEPMTMVKRDLQMLIDHGVVGNLSDGGLLDRFVARREEAAFEEIVRRHGPMVWGVCRRILRNTHDAEDAFQATFLVLARRAPSIAHREMVASWLYRVACKTGLKARSVTARRRARERQMAELPDTEERRRSPRHDLVELLDRELSRLPVKYRVPVVLCELEGRTHREAAQQLGWPIGTVSGRLSRARTILADRLSRRGLVFTAPMLAMVLSQAEASANVPTPLLGSTVKAAPRFAVGRTTEGLISAEVAELADTVLRAVFVSKVIVTLVLIAAGVLGTGAGFQVTTMAVARASETRDDERSKQEGAAGAEPTKSKAKEAKASKTDDEKLQGIWIGKVIELAGERLPTDRDRVPPLIQIHINGKRLGVRGPKFEDAVTFGTPVDTEFTIRLDATKSPKAIDFVLRTGSGAQPPRVYRGIYSLRAGKLKICLSTPSEERPTEFRTRTTSSQMVLEFSQPVMQDAPRIEKRLMR
jgi:RNA polymerase sigma factor (sigma-70 family)